MLFALQETYDYQCNVKKHLIKQMIRAKRRGIWFKLSSLERSIFTLSIRLNVKIKSLQLIRALASILKKLRLLENQLHALISKGWATAWAFSSFAVRNGYEQASLWRNDKNYAIYLAVIFAG